MRTTLLFLHICALVVGAFADTFTFTVEYDKAKYLIDQNIHDITSPTKSRLGFGEAYGWWFFGDHFRGENLAIKISNGSAYGGNGYYAYFAPGAKISFDPKFSGDEQQNGTVILDSSQLIASGNHTRTFEYNDATKTYTLPDVSSVSFKLRAETLIGLVLSPDGETRNYKLYRDDTAPTFNHTVTYAAPGGALGATEVVHFQLSGIGDTRDGTNPGAGVASITYSVDAGPDRIDAGYASGTELGFEVTLSQIGVHKITVYVADKLGNESIATVEGIAVNAVSATNVPSVAAAQGSTGDVVTLPLNLRAGNLAQGMRVQFTLTGATLPATVRDTSIVIPIGTGGVPDNVTPGVPAGMGIILAPDGSASYKLAVPLTPGVGRKNFAISALTSRPGETGFGATGTSGMASMLAHDTLVILSSTDGRPLDSDKSIFDDVLVSFNASDAGGSSPGTYTVWSVGGAVTPTQGMAIGGNAVSGTLGVAGTPPSPVHLSTSTNSDVRTVIVRIDDGAGSVWYASKAFAYSSALIGDITDAKKKSGNVVVTGDVIVKQGGKLTIEAGTKVSFAKGLNGEVFRILVQAGGELEVQPGAVLADLGSGVPEVAWQGIVAEAGSTVTVAGATLQYARRAITVLGIARIVISGSVIANNVAGVNVFASSYSPGSLVSGTTFSSNTYGIKLDNVGSTTSAAPTLQGLTFSGNVIDYYDPSDPNGPVVPVPNN